MRELTFRLRSLEFSALEWGEPKGIPLLLVHGWMDQAAIWLRLAERLAEKHWVIAVDLRGFGQSAHNPPSCAYAFAEYLLDLDALIAQLGKSVVLIGHSMGGTICSLYAGIRREWVQALVVLDGLGLPDGLDGTVERWRDHLEGYGSPVSQRLQQSVEEAARRLSQFNPALDPEHAFLLARRGTRAVEGGVQWSADPRHRLKLAAPYRQDQHRRVLSEISCPVLLVHPQHTIFQPEDVERLEGAIPNARHLTVPESGHMLLVEVPGPLAQAVDDFLRVSHILPNAG